MSDGAVLKNFRVTQVEIATKSRTITAATPEEALKKVAEGAGADAGSEGPATFAAIAQDRALLPKPPTLQGVMGELQMAWQLLEQARARFAEANPMPPVEAVKP